MFCEPQGLGKTAQAIAVLEYQRQLEGVRGPFLVVAPLTTLGHWQREIETWTPMVRFRVLGFHVLVWCACSPVPAQRASSAREHGG